MTVLSSELLDAARLAYSENADYDEAQSLAKARAYRTACRRLIGLLASFARQGDEEVRFEILRYENELKAATRYITGVQTAKQQLSIHDPGCLRDQAST